MGKSTISMAIFNSYFDITRGYLRQTSLLSPSRWGTFVHKSSSCLSRPQFTTAHSTCGDFASRLPPLRRYARGGLNTGITGRGVMGQNSTKLKKMWMHQVQMSKFLGWHWLPRIRDPHSSTPTTRKKDYPMDRHPSTWLPRCPRSANLYSPGRRNQTTAPAAILPTPNLGCQKAPKIAKDNRQFSSSSIFVASVSSSASPLVIDDGVNKYENKRAFANVAGPVAHWMRRCAFNAVSSINIAWRFDSSQVRFAWFHCLCGRYGFAAVSELLCLLFPEPLGNSFVWRQKPISGIPSGLYSNPSHWGIFHKWLTVWTLTQWYTMVYPLAIPQNTSLATSKSQSPPRNKANWKRKKSIVPVPATLVVSRLVLRGYGLASSPQLHRSGASCWEVPQHPWRLSSFVEFNVHDCAWSKRGFCGLWSSHYHAWYEWVWNPHIGH